MILFTGLTGTSGTAFVDKMKAESFSGRMKVIVRETSDISGLADSNLRYELAYGSILDTDFLAREMAGCDTVFHIAAKACQKAVADAAVQAGCVKHVVLVSSTSIYSKYRKAGGKVQEQEEYCKRVLQEHQITYTIIRPTMIWGTLRDNNMSKFISYIDKFTLFPLIGKGQALLQPVHRKDLAEAYYQVLTNPEITKGKEYIVSGEAPMKLIDMLHTIGRTLGKRTYFVNVPLGIAKAGVAVIYALSFKKVDYREKLLRLTEDRNFSHDCITEELGYHPQPYEERLKPLAAEYLAAKKKA